MTRHWFLPCLVIGTVVPVVPLLFFRPFSVPPVVTAFTLRKALRLRNVPFFLYLLPRSWIAESCFRSVGLFPPGWNGSFRSWRFRVSLSVIFSAGRFSPIQEPWVPGYLVSLALALSSYCLRHVQGVQLLLPLLFITPFASLVFLENFGFMGVDGVFGNGF